MSREDEVTPVNHSALSATATTAAEAGKGGIFGFAKGIGAIPVAGAAIFGLWTFASGLSGAFAAIGAASGIGAGIVAGVGAFGGLLASTALWALGGAALFTVGAVAIGALTGVGLFGLLGGIGGVVGLVKGGSRGISKVERERAAADVMQAQTASIQAQAYAAGAQATANQYGAPKGSALNVAASTVLADRQYDGKINPAELAAARG